MEVPVLLWKMHPSKRLSKFSSCSGQEKCPSSDSNHPGRTQDQGRLMMVTPKRLLASSHLQPWDVSNLCHHFPEDVPFCVGTERSNVMGWLAAKLVSLRMSLVDNLF